jgi:hypothetical protein
MVRRWSRQGFCLSLDGFTVAVIITGVFEVQHGHVQTFPNSDQTKTMPDEFSESPLPGDQIDGSFIVVARRSTKTSVQFHPASAPPLATTVTTVRMKSKSVLYNHSSHARPLESLLTSFTIPRLYSRERKAFVRAQLGPVIGRQQAFHRRKAPCGLVGSSVSSARRQCIGLFEIVCLLSSPFSVAELTLFSVRRTMTQTRFQFSTRASLL